MSTLEIRTGKAAGRVELRTAGNGAPQLFGYALKFNTLSQNLGGFVESIAPGAVDKTLADGLRIMCRYNHEDASLLGTTDAGTLRVGADDVGLPYECDLPDTQAGRDVAVLAGRGDLHASSFAFYTMPGGDDWSLTGQGFPLRTLTAIQLVDVAPVNSPAYLDTTSGLRSLAARVGLDVETVTHTPTEQVRALILGETRSDLQVENHSPGSDLIVVRMQVNRQAITLHSPLGSAKRTW